MLWTIFKWKKGQLPVSNSLLTNWIKSTPELHLIKSKPIARARVEMYSSVYLKRLFKGEYVVALKYSGTCEFETYEAAKRLHYIDEKGARLAFLGRRKISMLVRIDDGHASHHKQRLIELAKINHIYLLLFRLTKLIFSIL